MSAEDAEEIKQKPKLIQVMSVSYDRKKNRFNYNEDDFFNLVAEADEEMK